MKVCHICEKIVKVLRSVSCQNCKRSYCFPCISKYFPHKAKELLPETEADALNKSKVKSCFYCLKECICDKCRVTTSFLVQVKKDGRDQNQIQSGKLSSFVKDEEIITQSGFFKGKRFNQMPGFMQRAYLKKKVLYSKHELSMPSMISIAQVEQINAERLEEPSKKEEKKGGQSGEQVEQSLNPNQQGDVQVSAKNQMDIENQNQNQEQQIIENEQDENEQSGEQNENIGSSQYNANEGADQNQEESMQQQNAEQNGAGEQAVSSNKNESNQQSKGNPQKKVDQVQQNVQDQSSIQQVHEE